MPYCLKEYYNYCLKSTFIQVLPPDPPLNWSNELQLCFLECRSVHTVSIRIPKEGWALTGTSQLKEDLDKPDQTLPNWFEEKIEQLRTWTSLQSADWVNREGLAPGSNNSPTAPTLSNSNPGLLEYVSLKILEQHHPYQQSPLPPWLSSQWSPSWFTNGTTITPTISAPQAPMCARLVFLSLTNFHKRSHSFFSSSP